MHLFLQETLPTRDYTYNATGTATDTVNVLSINNLGGYGLNTNTIVRLNCNQDSLYIDQQVIGNGVTLSGSGTFTANTLTINYSAVKTPGQPAEVCTATLTTN